MTPPGAPWDRAVLVAIDDTERSHASIAPATMLGEALGVPVELVSVVSPAAGHLDARMALEELQAAHPGVAPATLVLESNDVAEALVAESAQRQALLCLATHARGPVGSLVVGSTARAVLAASQAPVLLVGRDAVVATSLRRVLVAAPPWRRARRALDAALRLATAVSAATQVVRVVPDADEETAAIALADLNALVAEVRPVDVPISTTVTVGVDVGGALVWAIEDSAADLAVLPARRHPTLERVLGQDVVGEVLRRGHRPVLVVPIDS